MQTSDHHLHPFTSVFTVLSMLMALSANMMTEYAIMDERVKDSRSID